MRDIAPMGVTLLKKASTTQMSHAVAYFHIMLHWHYAKYTVYLLVAYAQIPNESQTVATARLCRGRIGGPYFPAVNIIIQDRLDIPLFSVRPHA